MRLANAIRLGAMMKPQGFGPGAIRSVESSCVLGAAADALGLAEKRGRYGHLQIIYPFLTQRILCPVTGDNCTYSNYAFKGGELYTMMYHLNDTHKWTREQIADWLEPIELAHGIARAESILAKCKERADALEV